MTSRPDAAAAPSQMTVSSMVRPLAVVMVDMGISSWWRLAREAENRFPLENRPCRGRRRCCSAAEASMYAKEPGLATSICIERLEQPAIAAAMSRLGWSTPSHNRNIVAACFSRTRIACDVHGREADMGQNVSDLEELISEFREMLPAQSKTAQAIDRLDPFDEIADKA